MKRTAIIFLGLVMLAGCGSTDKDRAVSGGAIGAGLGTATGLVIGGPLAGFVLGGAVGTATGLVTDQDTIDLGKPIWKQDDNEPLDLSQLSDEDGTVTTAITETGDHGVVTEDQAANGLN